MVLNTSYGTAHALYGVKSPYSNFDKCTKFLSNSHKNSKNVAVELKKYQPLLPYFFSGQLGKFLPPVQNVGSMIIVANLNFWRGPKFSSNTFKTHKNITLYFKGVHLIIHKYESTRKCIFLLSGPQ